MSPATHFWIKNSHLEKILSRPFVERSKHVIGGLIFPEREELKLIFADFQILTVPFSLITPSKTETPDFSKPKILDYGQVLALGTYQSTIDALLPTES